MVFCHFNKYTKFQVLFQLITLFSLLWEVIILCYFGRGSIWFPSWFSYFHQVLRFCDSYRNIFSLSVQLKIKFSLLKIRGPANVKKTQSFIGLLHFFHSQCIQWYCLSGFCIGSRNYFTSNKKGRRTFLEIHFLVLPDCIALVWLFTLNHFFLKITT